MLVVTAAKVSRYLTSYVAMGLHRAASAGAVDTVLFPQFRNVMWMIQTRRTDR